MISTAIERIRSARPSLTYITRLTATAAFAYLLALLIPAATARPVLAPLTALLVLQASLYQTIRSGIRKVASVTVGVLVAVVVSEFIGFSWWQLTLVIGGALAIGSALRLGDDLLEVPISAMLIFASAGSQSAATGRVVDTLVGTAAGLAGGLVFGKPRVQSAREAVGTLAGRLADLLGQMAADLGRCAAGDEAPDSVGGWLTQARALRDEIERVDDTLRQAADSVRINPRSRLGLGRSSPGSPAAPVSLLVTEVALRGGVETLELATVTVRGLARSVLDATGIDSDSSPVRDQPTRARLAAVLGQLAAAIRTYGQLLQLFPEQSEPLHAQLTEQLAAAHRAQDELAALLEPRVPADGGSSQWPLRGAILTHVDRLRTGLEPDAVLRAERPRPQPRRRRREAARVPARRDRVRGQARAQLRGQARAQVRGRARAWHRAGRAARYSVRERISAQRAR
jgi:Aromatic acid exporter family member 1